MNAANTLHISPRQAVGKSVVWTLRFIGLVVLYFVLFAAGGGLVAPYLPAGTAEPGPVPANTGLLIVCIASVLVIMLMIHSSRWSGWRLILSMSIAYYLVVTFVTQLESWYFLYGITIGPELMSRLFLQGLPVAFGFVPLAVLIMGRLRPLPGLQESPELAPVPRKAWIWRLGIIALAYLVLYFSAGYFIAWQNPDVRAFYGSPGEALSFLQMMRNNFVNDPWLIPYQLFRSLIWAAGAYLIIRGSRLSFWQTALIVGLVLSVPQNIGHILPNPLIPIASVRMSHLVETASSTFVFGLIVSWLLYPKYLSGKS